MQYRHYGIRGFITEMASERITMTYLDKLDSIKRNSKPGISKFITEIVKGLKEFDTTDVRRELYLKHNIETTASEVGVYLYRLKVRGVIESKQRGLYETQSINQTT